MTDPACDILNYRSGDRIAGFAYLPRRQSSMIPGYKCQRQKAAMSREARSDWWRSSRTGVHPSRAIAAGLGMVALVTAALATLYHAASLEHVTIVYLIPVMIVATRWGVVPAVIVALAAMATSAFVFYEPIYDFRVNKAEHIVDLILFLIVAVVTGRLASSARQAETQADAEALREAMIGAVSHELRTPLASIVGLTSVLAASAEIASNARLQPLVAGLHEAADRLNEHIQNLLDATRITSDGIRPRIEWVDPGDIVNAALERKAELLARHRVVRRVAPDLPLVRTDAALMEKAYGQLLENAAKYSPAGTAIEVSATKRDSTVLLTVRDEGSGFAPAERDVIWDRFYRSPRHRDRIAGSGLGLWIARALAAACGAATEAYSVGAGYGATFTLLLPVQAGPDPDADDNDE
jgi:K+-sensing histidine kinase KdpD